jgi:hypothetical protein
VYWLESSVVLCTVAVAMYRLLRLGPPDLPEAFKYTLDSNRQSIYSAVVMELEARAAMIGVALNDAIEEHESGNAEIAQRLVRLAAAEWRLLAEGVTVLLGALSDHLPLARRAFTVRGLVAHRFKSPHMIDYARVHEWLSQWVFRSRLRFHLHVRVLRRAAHTLTGDFLAAHRYLETHERDRAEWQRLDRDFHDFDLITKEALLAFRSFLPSLPDSALPGFAADLKAVIEGGVRSRVGSTQP